MKYAIEDTLKSPVSSASERRQPRSERVPEYQEVGKYAQMQVKVEVSLKERLSSDLKQAMRDGDKVRRSVVRLVLAAIQNAEIAKQTALEDTDILGIIAREARQHQESIEAFRQGDRQDLVTQEEAELAILQEYLPQQVSREEIIAAARQIIEEVGAEGPGDKGKVMPKLITELKGKADGREINAVVTELLSS